ncbi:MAG: tRNA-dihydrouridine synthase family protein [Treponema sp.]|nr:tRNA-dihydrouridine synthase family protein [Spirochaetales bacterium]MDY4902657.1 tRNA-dihydrouridine synthase family protein [Treponema sp.]
MTKLICAPMATLSTEAFRRSVESFGGCDEYFTEMINASSLLNMGPWEKYYLMNEVCPEKIVWQLTGNNGDKLAQAVPVVCEKGGIGVDLNMGCSAPQIYKTGAGISWMTKPLKETEDAVKKVKRALEKVSSEQNKNFRLSVKCRLGNEDFTTESLFDFVQMLTDNGVELVTLHPRTIKEKYRGLPKYEYAEELALKFPQTVFYLNGCIKDNASLSYAMEKSPSSKGMMIARQAAAAPWIFAQLKKQLHSQGSSYEKITVDRKQTALNFISDITECQPQEFFKTRIQRFFNYYCQQFSFGHWFQSLMLNYKSVEDSKEKVEAYFEKVPQDRFLEI